MLVADTTGSLNTTFGLLLLDPFPLSVVFQGTTDSSRLISWPYVVPPSLSGLQIPLQALGRNDTGTFQLTGLWTLEIP